MKSKCYMHITDSKDHKFCKIQNIYKNLGVIYSYQCAKCDYIISGAYPIVKFTCDEYVMKKVLE